MIYRVRYCTVLYIINLIRSCIASKYETLYNHGNTHAIYRILSYASVYWQDVGLLVWMVVGRLLLTNNGVRYATLHNVQ